MQTIISTHVVLIDEVVYYTIKMQRFYIFQKGDFSLGISDLDLASRDAIHI